MPIGCPLDVVGFEILIDPFRDGYEELIVIPGKLDGGIFMDANEKDNTWTAN